ncbi:MAG TPA: alpha/beta hydrolase [Pseudonocardia sp.]|nr:alpha/beta hydrolase [Pseudonocardia sp.]
MHVTAADGTRLFYRDWGSGPPVVFTHSWSLHSAMWEYQFTALLAEGFRCVAHDRRGHGRSDERGRGYDLHTLAGDLAALLEHLDLRDVTLVGHSMGCSEIVRYLAAHGSERVSRAVLVGAMTPLLLRTDDAPEGLDPMFLQATLQALRTDRPRWFRESAAGYFATAGTGSWVSPALVDDGVATILACPLEVQTTCLQVVMGTDLRADLRGIDVPVLLVHGDADESAPIDLTARRTAPLIPDARLEVYAGAPHGLYVTEAARLTKDVLAFARP